MKVSVVGPGALGCLFAARLAEKDIQTTLIDHRPDRAATLHKNGITVERPDGQSLTAKPAVTTQIPAKQDLIIVLVKSYSTRSLRLPADVPVLTLQNGLDNVEALCEMVGSNHVIAGTTCEAVTYLEQGHVRHTAAGLNRIGAWTSCPTDTAQQALEKAGFEVEITDAPGQAIWEKVAVCAGIHPLTALLNLPNGAILDIKEVRELLRNLVVEAAKVASMEGYRFDYSLVERAETVCRDTKDNISSMLQDVRAGRRTEVDAISGAILERAQISSLPCPRTRMAWQLLRGLENR